MYVFWEGYFQDKEQKKIGFKGNYNSRIAKKCLRMYQKVW